jgi:hypothetical protein
MSDEQKMAVQTGVLKLVSHLWLEAWLTSRGDQRQTGYILLGSGFKLPKTILNGFHTDCDLCRTPQGLATREEEKMHQVYSDDKSFDPLMTARSLNWPGTKVNDEQPKEINRSQVPSLRQTFIEKSFSVSDGDEDMNSSMGDHKEGEPQTFRQEPGNHMRLAKEEPKEILEMRGADTKRGSMQTSSEAKLVDTLIGDFFPARKARKGVKRRLDTAELSPNGVTEKQKDGDDEGRC